MTELLDRSEGPAGGPEPPEPAALARQALNVLGDKWRLRLLAELSRAPRRYRELKSAVPGMSDSMLTRTLRALERDGFVSRDVTPAVPVQCTYSVTELGRSLEAPVAALVGWSATRMGEVHAARLRYDSSALLHRAYR